jgi:hypothetical protein
MPVLLAARSFSSHVFSSMHVDYIDFVKANGISYIGVDYFNSGLGVGRALVEADLGPEHFRVKQMLSGEAKRGRVCSTMFLVRRRVGLRRPGKPDAIISASLQDPGTFRVFESRLPLRNLRQTHRSRASALVQAIHAFGNRLFSQSSPLRSEPST